MNIHGKKIDLKEWHFENDYDYPAVLRWFTDPEVMKYVGFFKDTFKFTTVAEIKADCDKFMNDIHFGIYMKNGQLVGMTTLACENNDEYRFGIFIGEKSFWGQGIGTETTQLVSQYAFDQLGAKRVSLNTAGRNVAGQKAYMNAGFKVEKLIENERTIFIDGVWQPDDTVHMVKDKGL